MSSSDDGNKLPRETLKIIEDYNTLNNSFSNTSPLTGGKVILVGESAVGKTCLFVRAIKNVFGNQYRPTIGLDFNVKEYNIYDIPFPLSIWDTAGQERFRSLSTSYHRGANACILTFDLNNADSLHKIKSWYNEVHTYSEEPNIKWFLVGTKCDLVRHADDREIELLTKELNAEYWEVSSLNGTNVDELFNRVAFVSWKDKLEQWKKSNDQFLNREDNIKDLNEKTGDSNNTTTSKSGGFCCYK
ncbi:hypothetical protein ABK040_001822 [Willaertia magna]